LKLVSPVPGSPPAAADAPPAVKAIVASSTAVKRAANAICHARITAAGRRPPTTDLDLPGPGAALVRLARTIRARR
jgi:hypothetical protein